MFLPPKDSNRSLPRIESVPVTHASIYTFTEDLPTNTATSLWLAPAAARALARFLPTRDRKCPMALVVCEAGGQCGNIVNGRPEDCNWVLRSGETARCRSSAISFCRRHFVKTSPSRGLPRVVGKTFKITKRYQTQTLETGKKKRTRASVNVPGDSGNQSPWTRTMTRHPKTDRTWLFLHGRALLRRKKRRNVSVYRI